MELFYREQYISKIRGFYHDTDIIKVITGVRRCGKSSLMEMIKDELIKDIKRRVKIRNVEVFEAVRNFIINNFGATMSIQSLQHSLQKAGLSVQRATLKRYIDELVSAKILYQCNRFDMKSKKALSGEKKYYLADTSFYFAFNTDNRINYGPALENMLYLYARGKNYAVSVGRIGRLECDFILRDIEQNYSYIQIAYTINESKQTEDREYKPLEMIRDNYPKYVATTDYLLQKRNGIKHINILEFIKDGKKF